MRSQRLLLIIGLWLMCAPAGAEEPVLARVVEVAADQVTLAVEDGTGGESRQLTVNVGANGVPAGVEPGRLVRVWPGVDGDPKTMIQEARLVPLRGKGTGRDRTGVRSRLMRGAGRGRGGARGGR